MTGWWRRCTRSTPTSTSTKIAIIYRTSAWTCWITHSDEWDRKGLMCKIFSIMDRLAISLAGLGTPTCSLTFLAAGLQQVLDYLPCWLSLQNFLRNGWPYHQVWLGWALQHAHSFFLAAGLPQVRHCRSFWLSLSMAQGKYAD